MDTEKGESSNNGKQLSVGNSLISGLIDAKEKISIQTGKENVTNKSKNGDSSIIFDPNNKADGSKVNAIQNADGSYGRPAEIGLAHELTHAESNAKGTVDKTKVTVVNPDVDSTGQGQGKVVVTDQDELNSRAKENQIREEQGVTPRATPEIVR